MAWGYNSGNGLFTGYEPKTYQEDVATRGTGFSGGAADYLGEGMNEDWMAQYHAERAAKEKAQGRGYGGGGGSSSKSATQTTKLRFTEPMPETPDLPTLTLPKVDKRKIRALTQQIAAPGIRELREKMGSAMNVASDNPNVRRMTLREALQGYGTGLERAMAGAGSQARAENAQDLNRESQEAQANWQAKTQALMTTYQNAFNRYMQGAERVTETNATTGGPAADGSGEWYRTSFGSLRQTGPGGSRYGGTF